jgi:hypothetical protein
MRLTESSRVENRIALAISALPQIRVMFEKRKWALTKNALERVLVNRANLILVMNCIFLVPSMIDLEVAALLIIVLA